ncbi:sensor histidine kinase [Robiginitomaculum antarcticum]|uniref:sensor histidine kinase n=1 Tax=Robiginitomaculum antarcticum TaxID=437507 RepID=UPI0014616106|nr:ATP-binding protein [Robiginitomaculum antarcticum]
MTAPNVVVHSLLFGIFFLLSVGFISTGAFFAFTGTQFKTFSAGDILNANFVIIIGLAYYLGYRVWRNLFSAKAGESAPQLHRRFLLIFSLAALLPAIVIGSFFASVMNRDINSVWDETIEIGMAEANLLTSSFMLQQDRQMRQEMNAMAGDLNQNSALLANRITFTSYLIAQAVFRELPSVYIVNRKGEILARAESAAAPPFRLPSPEMWRSAEDTFLTMDTHINIDFLTVLVRLDGFEDAYLYVGKYVEKGTFNSIVRLVELNERFQASTTRQDEVNKLFSSVYVQSALLLLMAAVWLGLVLAGRIVTPLGNIVQAAEKVRSGDLSARVTTQGSWDEIADLASAFNRMTRQLGAQRDDLIREHDTSEQRRIFSEAVLSGVSAGIIGLSQDGRITLMNQSAVNLLGNIESSRIGQPIGVAIPAFKAAFKRAQESVGREIADQVDYEGEIGTRNFDLRISSYHGETVDTGWVITFDDMTRLVAAQRHSAWREVARRVAHEIKNPLTPIQLSAERLERKYLKQITSEPETFVNLTQTITRQVDSLERMVEAFSNFARTPALTIEPVNFEQLLDRTLFAQRVAFPDIEFINQNEFGRAPIIDADERLLGQALTNLLKNAGESVTARVDADGLDQLDGQIKVLLREFKGALRIDIIDNGTGWPLTNVDKLFEPYVTTRESGTGLGLAIVKRIIEDHGGTLNLKDRPDSISGAYVCIEIPMGTGQLSNRIAAE